MSSNLASILSATKTLLAAVSTVKAVDESPARAEDWLDAMRSGPASRLPALHVALLDSTGMTPTTSGDLAEDTDLVVTCVFARMGATQGTFITLRDGIVSALWPVGATLAPYADTVEPVDVKFVSQDAEHAVFEVKFTVHHEWAP